MSNTYCPFAAEGQKRNKTRSRCNEFKVPRVNHEFHSSSLHI